MNSTLLRSHNDTFLSQGYHSLMRALEYSGEFDISRVKLVEVPTKYRRKEEGFSLAIINGVTVAFDANGGCYNIESMYNDGLFNTIFKDVRYIIKTQYHPHKFWDELQKETGITVISWIMWSTLNFPMGCFKWDPNRNFKFIATCAGGPNSNRRWGRPKYIQWCLNDKSFHHHRTNVHEFSKVLEECKWGLILQGGNKYNCDGKNTREIEYSSCGMPLALNYIPHYEYDFIPDKHFLYLKSPNDLERLKTEDPRPYARESAKLWDNYLKPQSAGKYLKRLMNV